MTRSLVSLVVIAAVEISPVTCFSARLPRPWEPLGKTSTSLARRRRSWEDSALQSASVSSAQNKDSDDAETSSTDEEETMSLQKKDDDVASVPISQPYIVHTTSEAFKTDRPTVRSSLRLLFLMTRPFSNVGVVLFHILGVYLALQSPNVGNAQLLSTLVRPSMFIVLLCLLLTSATSMVVRCRGTTTAYHVANNFLMQITFSLYRLMIISIIKWELILTRFTSPWWKAPFRRRSPNAFSPTFIPHSCYVCHLFQALPHE